MIVSKTQPLVEEGGVILPLSIYNLLCARVSGKVVGSILPLPTIGAHTDRHCVGVTGVALSGRVLNKFNAFFPKDQ